MSWFCEKRCTCGLKLQTDGEGKFWCKCGHKETLSKSKVARLKKVYGYAMKASFFEGWWARGYGKKHFEYKAGNREDD